MERNKEWKPKQLNLSNMELFRALAVIAEPPTGEAALVAEALELGALPGADEYTELFIFQLYPYASVYLGAEGMMGGEARETIAGFWRALGQMPPTEVDHLSVMLALYARLCELEDKEAEGARRSGWSNARKAFLWEHLLSWLPVYLSKLAEVATPFYQKWGEILMKALLAEAATLGPQEALPLHLREALTLVDPRAEDAAAEFRQSILTPARFGGILTRADLTRAARKVGVGLRMGERQFILKMLLAQDATGIFDWLIEEAAVWQKRHHGYMDALGAISQVWERRAAASAALLQQLKLAAAEAI
jgi:TorA maturation chaperone TorD